MRKMSLSLRNRWGVERRMEFIEFRLYWEGKINRNDLTTFFGISTPQASADFSNYQKIASENIEYDHNAKTYIATNMFSPLFLSPDPGTYFRELTSIASNLISEESSFIGWKPDFAITPTLTRNVEPNTLYRVLYALRNNTSINIKYQSMSTPEPGWRIISPHAIGYNGFRWHIRAYCQKRKTFVDFSFFRILSIGDDVSISIEPQTDRLWHEYVSLVIEPNKLLSNAQQEITKLEYGMCDDELSIPVRGALFFYLCNQLNFKDETIKNPSDTQHILPKNWDEACKAVKELEMRSKLD